MNWKSLVRKYRQLLLMVAASTAVAATIILVSSMHERVRLTHEFESRAGYLAKMLALSSRHGLEEGDREETLSGALFLLAEPSVEAFQVTDGSGEVLATYSRSPENATILRYHRDPGYVWEQHLLVAVTSVYSQSRYIGRVAVLMQDNYLQEVLGRGSIINGLLVLAAFGLSLFIGVRLDSSLKRPLIEFSEMVKRAVEGPRILAESEKIQDDELRDIRDSFNSLVDTLEKTKSDRRQREARLVADLKRKGRSLQTRDACMKAIFDDSPMPMLMVSEDGNVVSYNDAGRDLLHISRGESPNLALIELVQGAGRDRIKALYREAVSEGGNIVREQFQVVMASPYRNMFLAELSFRSFMTVTDKSFIVHIRDLSREQEMALTLESIASARDEDNKQTLVYPVQLAELHGGLEMIRVGLDVAAELIEARDRGRALKIVKDMLRLLNRDLLTMADIARMSNGQQKCELTPFILPDALSNFLDRVCDELVCAPERIQFSIHNDVPEIVYGDAFLFNRLMTEVAKVLVSTGELDCYTIEIIDIVGGRGKKVLGIGIQAKCLTELVRAEGSGTTSSSSQISLQLIRTIVEIMGGEIADYGNGKGALIHLPMLGGVGADRIELTIVRECLKGKRALILDNQPTSAQIMRDITFKQLKMKPVVCALLDDFIKELQPAVLDESVSDQKEEIQLIVIDVDVAFSDRDRFSKLVSALSAFSTVPVVLKGGGEEPLKELEESIARTFRVGKPLALSSFLQSVEEGHWANIIERVRTLFPLGTLLQSRDQHTDSLNVMIAKSDPAEATLMSRMFLECGHSVSVIGSGHGLIAALENKGNFQRESAEKGIDIVLLDSELPDMNTIEALKEIRAREKNTAKHVTLVVLGELTDEVRVSGTIDGVIHDRWNIQQLAGFLWP